MKKKNIFAISLFICIPLLMSTCSFTPLEIERPAPLSLENVVPGVPNTVRISGLNHISIDNSGARSVARVAVDRGEITFGAMTFNSVSETSVNFDLALMNSEGGNFATITSTMFLSDQVAVVNGNELPIYSFTNIRGQNIYNAILVEGMGNNNALGSGMVLDGLGEVIEFVSGHDVSALGMRIRCTLTWDIEEDGSYRRGEVVIEVELEVDEEAKGRIIDRGLYPKKYTRLSSLN